jgi:hypothetical protein
VKENGEKQTLSGVKIVETKMKLKIKQIFILSTTLYTQEVDIYTRINTKPLWEKTQNKYKITLGKDTE